MDRTTKALDHLLSLRNKGLTEEEKKIEVQKAVDELIPSYKEYLKAKQEYENSFSFAYSELKRFYDHMNEKHKDNTDDCPIDNCFEGFDMDRFKLYAQRVYEGIKAEIESEGTKK